jgi:hypothetical protein
VPTEIEDRLAELRLALPEPGRAAGDRMLGAVLAGWSPPRRRHSWVAPRTLLVAALVLLVGGSLAYAIGGRVVDAVTGAPAPAKIKHQLDTMLRPLYPTDGAPPWQQQLDRTGKIVKGSERRLITIRTRWHGSASLYVARTTTGGYCDLSGWAKSGLGGGCMPLRHFTEDGQPLELETLSMTRGHVLFTGRVVSERATSLRLRTLKGESTTLALTAGWFLYEVPTHNQRSGADPVVAIDVLDASGARIGRYTDPFRLHAPKPQFTEPVPSSIRPLTTATLPNDGGTITVWSGRDPNGHPCFRLFRNGFSQRGPAWQCTADVDSFGYGMPTAAHPQGGQHVPVSWNLGLRNDPKHPVGVGYAYAYGWVRPGVTRLELRFQDGGRTDISLLAHGDFLYVVPPTRWPAGHRPSILTAYGADGHLVYRQFLYPRQHCIYPGYDPACKNYGMATG